MVFQLPVNQMFPSGPATRWFTPHCDALVGRPLVNRVMVGVGKFWSAMTELVVGILFGDLVDTFVTMGCVALVPVLAEPHPATASRKATIRQARATAVNRVGDPPRLVAPKTGTVIKRP